VAITASGLYYTTFRDALSNTIALDLASDTDNKIALHSNSLSPNFDSDTVWTNGSEVTGTGWVTGGYAIGTTTFGVSTGTLQWGGANVSQSGTTLSGVRGGLIYGLQGSTKNLVCLVNFTQDYGTSNGIFAINWSGGLIFTIDLTP
jgi:hypothetical protein